MVFARDVGRTGRGDDAPRAGRVCRIPGRMEFVVAIGLAGAWACGGDDVDDAALGSPTDLGLPAPPPGNRPPTALLEVSPTSGTAPLEVRIRVDGDDPDGSVILYVADLNGDGDQDDLGESQSRPIDVTRTFDESVTIRARVQDDVGAFSPQRFEDITVQRPDAGAVATGVGRP